MELRYTAQRINEIEVANKNKHFSTALGDLRMKTLALWVQKGMGLDTVEQAFDEMDKYFADGNDIGDLSKLIMKALQAAGQIDKSVDLDKQIEEAREVVEPKKVLENNGETER